MDIRYFNQVEIPIGKITLNGELFIPLKAQAIIVFSHGSGSSRFSKRNQMVAKNLHENNFGTLLFDLLTEEEDINYSNRFDIDLLSKRLAGAATWLGRFPAAKNCRIGFFGASTGAASALRVAAIMPEVFAVISRGGRPDLAISELPKVNAPTLFIVGSLDYDVIQLNQKALQQLTCEKKLEIIHGATHLFEEKGTMEKVCVLATLWFKKYLEPAEILKKEVC
jgi:putative phosphoribosyl transferase